MAGLDLRDMSALKKRNIVFGYDGNHDMFDWQNTTTNLETRYVVQGDWKYLGNVKGEDELYNITADPWEKKNLAGEQPEKVAALSKTLDAWWKPE